MNAAAVEAKRRVLVADDDEDHRAWLASALRQKGFDVVEAGDGRELLFQLLAVPAGFFSCVVTDQVMPGMRGTEVLARASARAPFIVVTGYDDPGTARAAAQFGAISTLKKPVDLREIERLVDGVTTKHGSGTYPAAVPPKPKS